MATWRTAEKRSFPRQRQVNGARMVPLMWWMDQSVVCNCISLLPVKPGLLDLFFHQRYSSSNMSQWISGSVHVQNYGSFWDQFHLHQLSGEWKLPCRSTRLHRWMWIPVWSYPCCAAVLPVGKTVAIPNHPVRRFIRVHLPDQSAIATKKRHFFAYQNARRFVSRITRWHLISAPWFERISWFS